MVIPITYDLLWSDAVWVVRDVPFMRLQKHRKQLLHWSKGPRRASALLSITFFLILSKIILQSRRNLFVCVVKLHQNMFWDVTMKTKLRLTDLVMKVELVPSLLGVWLSSHVGGNMTDESSPPRTSLPSASFRGKGSPHATNRSINLLSPTSKL